MKSHRKKGQASNHLIASILLIVCMVVIRIDAITSVTFSGGNTIHVVVNNSGTLDFVIAQVWIDNEKQAFTTNSSVGRLSPNEIVEISVVYVYVNETSYHIKIVSDRTNEYFASATAL